MKKSHKITALIIVLLLATLLAGCSNAQPGPSTSVPVSTNTAAQPTVPAATVSPSESPSASSNAPAVVLKKDQLAALEAPLTALLLTVEEIGADYPDKSAAVDPQFAEYYLFYLANNFYNKNIKTYRQFKDPAFKQFIAFTKADADKLLTAAFGKRFLSSSLPAFDVKSKGNIAFIEKDTVYVGADLGGPSSVTYAGGEVTLQNGKADVQYKYNYVPMTHGLEYNGTLTATVSQESGGSPYITALAIPQPEDSNKES